MAGINECTNSNFPAQITPPQDQIVENAIFNSTRLIPDMKFTCNGTIMGVKMAGRPMPGGFSTTGTRAPGKKNNNMNQNILLQIWRKKNFNNYYKVNDVALPCNSGQLNSLREAQCAIQQDCVQIYECTLKKIVVNVKAEDILGITMPPEDNVRFLLYFQNSTVSSHIFARNSGPVSLSNHTNYNGTDVQPLIMVEVATEPGNYNNIIYAIAKLLAISYLSAVHGIPF